MLTPRKGLPAGITHRQMYLRMTKETQYVNDARRDSVRFAVYDIPAPCNVPKRQEFARWHVCVFFVRNKKKTRDGRRSDSLRLMATAATITVLRPGDSTPGDFARSVFVVCAPSEEGDFLKLLGTAIAGTDGASVIFMSGDAGESEDERWRSEALEVSDAILCWLSAAGGAPEARRRFTRLVSQYGSSGKLFVGHPASEDAWAGPVEKCEGVSAARDPKALVAQANRQFSKGASRQGPERKVPQMIWHTPAWKKWYDALLSVGNRLDGAKVEWSFRVGPGGVYVLFWAVLANIWVAVERRHKSNEVVIARPDIACVLAFLPGADMLDTEIILVKEFRSPCRNESGFVHELPGGSSFNPHTDVLQQAADELHQETGIRVEKSRLLQHASRQAAATISTHHVHMFSCRLSDAEMASARNEAAEGRPHGNPDETERTYIVTATVRQCLQEAKVDFTTLGLIMQAIFVRLDVSD